MACITLDGLAICFFYFVFRSSVATIEEYTPLYLKQKGLSASLIGLVPMLGMLTQAVGIPVTSYLSDKFRSRKLFLFVAIVVVIPNILSFLLPSYPHAACLQALINTTRNFSHAESLDGTKTSGFEQEQLLFTVTMLLLRGVYELLKRMIVTQITVAAITHTKEDKTRYGYYVCWGQVGAGVSLFFIGILVGFLRIRICDASEPAYFVAFYYAAAFQITTLLPLSRLKFEYLAKRVIDYDEVKSIFYDSHYILMLALCVYGGMCSAFQLRWEFWYIEDLNGGPILFALSGLVRRPLLGLWFVMTRPIIAQLGEYNTIVISLLIFSASFIGLAFVKAAWLVIVFDIFQSLGFVLAFYSMVIHFAKAGSKASSACVQGMVAMMFHGVGKEIGTALFGFLFSTLGTKNAFCCYSVTTLLVLVIFLSYMAISTTLYDYTMTTNLTSDDEDCDTERKHEK